MYGINCLHWGCFEDVLGVNESMIKGMFHTWLGGISKKTAKHTHTAHVCRLMSVTPGLGDLLLFLAYLVIGVLSAGLVILVDWQGEATEGGGHRHRRSKTNSNIEP